MRMVASLVDHSVAWKAAQMAGEMAAKKADKMVAW